MAAPHRTGLAALGALLDAADATPSRVRPPIASIDHAAMTAAELQEAYDLFAQAERAGAIQVRHEKVGLGRHRPAKIALANADKLARFLGRPRAADSAASAIGAIFQALPNLSPNLRPVIDQMAGSWSRSKPWHRLEPGDVTGAIQALQIAGELIKRDRTLLIDERTFVVRACGDTKALQKRRETVLAVLIKAGLAEHDATFESFGITAFPEHVHLRGAVSLRLETQDLPLDFFYPSATIPPEQVNLAVISKPPTYLLTIENRTSFQRYVRQIRDGSLVVFTSGFLSEPCSTLIAKLASPKFPWFHWGDIDAGGLSIFEVLERRIARPAGIRIRPHMMTREIALAYGSERPERDQRLVTIAKSESAVAELALWLASDPNAMILEQEMLDPEAPKFLSDGPV